MITELVDKPYLCYIHREGRRIADFMLLLCDSDEAVGPALDNLLRGQPFVLAEVFDRHRQVLVRHGQAYAVAA